MDKTCIFCKSNLDNSDEHIIPQSINGRIHSRELICAKCNQKFGEKLDPVFKEKLGLILYLLEIGKTSKIEIENDKGVKFFFNNKTGDIEQVAPEIKEEILEDGKVALYISGPDSPKTYKALATKAARRFGVNALKGQFSVTKTTSLNESYSTKFELTITPKLLLALQKILVEFYGYHGLDLSAIPGLLQTVDQLNEDQTEVVLCNTKQETRKPSDTEIAHLLIIRNDKDCKILYGYVEILNVVCGHLTFIENYDGPEIDLVYHQDAITGEVLNQSIDLNFSEINSGEGDLQDNVNQVFERFSSRGLNKNFQLILDEIKRPLDDQKAEGKLTDEEHKTQFIEEAVKAAAMLSVENFDLFDDFTDEELRSIHFGNSIIRADKKEGFAFFYHQFVGHQFTFEDEDGMFVMEEFIYTKHKPRKDVSLLKVFCKFVSEKDGSFRFYPASNIFRIMGIPYLPDEFTWHW